MGRTATAFSIEPIHKVEVEQEQRDRPFYRPELDALRFFAFLAVFFSHVYRNDSRAQQALQNVGRYGVQLFFLLSAYLITELLRQERVRTGSVHLKKFYSRRILRIWPIYFLLIVIAAGIGAFYKPWQMTGLWLASSLLFTSNWFVIAYGWPANPMLAALWTISIEEQFYLLVPTIQKVGGAAFVNAFSWLVLISSYGFIWIRGLSQEHILNQNSLVAFQFFAAGSLLANYLKGSVPDIKVRYRALLLVCGISFWALANRLGFGVHFRASATHLTPVYATFSLLVGTILIFLSFLGASRRVKFPKTVLYLGTISYGLYIYHIGVLELMALIMKPLWDHRGIPFATALLSLIVAVAISSASYRWFETPFIVLKRRFELVKSKA